MSRVNNGGGGWSIESRTDELGRTLYSISIGDHVVVRDALSSDAAVIAARRWARARHENEHAEHEQSEAAAAPERTAGNTHKGQGAAG